MIQIQPRLQWKIKFLKWKLKNAGATVACAQLHVQPPKKGLFFFPHNIKWLFFFIKDFSHLKCLSINGLSTLNKTK